MLRPLFEKWLGTVIRHALTAVGAWLVTEGYLSESDSVQLVAGASALAVSVLLSFYQKYTTQVAHEVAKELPAGATNATVKAEIKKSDTAENISRALAVE